jgi:hypothetical protein
LGTSEGVDAQLPAKDRPVLPDRELTPLEEKLVAAAAAGEPVDRGEGPFELAEMRMWGEERTIRAAVLRHLLVADQWPLHAKGVRLRGVRISGSLDLEAAALRCPLSLDCCYLEADVCLDHATALRVTLTRCQLAGLTGEMLSARELDLQNSTLTGPLQLMGAQIVGQLICRGTKLNGADSDGYSLAADAMKTGGHVILDEGFTAAGAVRLPAAKIAGLHCSGAKLNGADSDGYSLAADWMKVGGGVFLDDEFTAVGGIALISAQVGASVWLTSAVLGTSSEVAFNATRARISGTLKWAPAKPVSGQVNLEGVTAGHLEDDWSDKRTNGYWPTDGRLNLDGFTYGRFGGARRATVQQRLDWIRSQYHKGAADDPDDFAAQPYEQLAAVYREAGQDDYAREVAIARRADLREYGNLNWYRRFGNWFLHRTIRYGYQTWRAAAYLAAVFAIFVVLSFLAQQHHLMAPVGDTDGLPHLPSATKCTSDYPCFYPFGYAIDTVIPIVNVHQADFWGPDGHPPWGYAWVAGTWIATGLGWALATLLVAGYTGLVRQD